MSKQTELENIFNSYEWLIRERLEQLDWMARKMFCEMGIFGVSQASATDYVQSKMLQVISEVTKKGEEDFAKTNNQLRRGKAKHS